MGLLTPEDRHLHYPEHPCSGAIAHDADSHLPTWKVSLHQHRLPMPLEQLPADGLEVFTQGNEGPGGHAFGAAFCHGLDEERQRQGNAVRLSGVLEHHEGGSRQAMVPHYPLCQRLVEGERAGQGIGEGIWLLEQLTDSRHLGLAGSPVNALRDGKNQIPALAGASRRASSMPRPTRSTWCPSSARPAARLPMVSSGSNSSTSSGRKPAAR